MINDHQSFPPSLERLYDPFSISFPLDTVLVYVLWLWSYLFLARLDRTSHSACCLAFLPIALYYSPDYYSIIINE